MKKVKITPIGKKLKGFSLLEMITAIFIFSIAITLSVSIFIGAFNSRGKSKEIQQATEDVRFAIEIMAKNIRMSTIDNKDNNRVYIFNYSQNKCIKYEFTGGDLKTGEVSLSSRLDGDGNIINCKDQSYSDQNMIKSGSLEKGLFFAVSSTETSVGKVSILIKVAGSPNAIQTTISLRDYAE